MSPRFPNLDHIRLTEAFRIGDTLGDRVWAGWSKAPFAVLLVTPDAEYLIRHPAPTSDFTPLGHDPLLGSDIHVRPRQFPPDLLAAFPAIDDVCTIVVGQAEATAVRISSPWVATVLHEHFHQYQDSQPNAYADMASLDLARGDQTGMWMLNYPFPYTDPSIGAQFTALCRQLAENLAASAVPDAALAEYLRARRAFRSLLAPDDYRYFAFQLWREGVARYTEWRIANLAAELPPTPAFVALPDYASFAHTADSLLLGRILGPLHEMDLATAQRGAFYAFGAAEASLLDRVNPDWQRRYFIEKFDLAPYFDA